MRKYRSFAEDGKSVKSTRLTVAGRQYEDGVMAYNGLAGIGRLTWKMDMYGSRTSPTRHMGRMGKESYLICQAVA